MIVNYISETKDEIIHTFHDEEIDFIVIDFSEGEIRLKEKGKKFYKCLFFSFERNSIKILVDGKIYSLGVVNITDRIKIVELKDCENSEMEVAILSLNKNYINICCYNYNDSISKFKFTKITEDLVTVEIEFNFNNRIEIPVYFKVKDNFKLLTEEI